MPLFKNDTVFFILDFETTGIDPDPFYPIELGVVVTDCELNKLEEFEAMISWPDLTDKVGAGEDYLWKQEYRPAYLVHKIDPKEYATRSTSPAAVASMMLKLVDRYSKKKCILISDNIRFEWQLLKLLMNSTTDRVRRGRNTGSIHTSYFTNWPWHYSGWDTSFALELLGVGDPPSETKKHRGLADAQELHTYMKKAYDIAQKWLGGKLV